MAKLENKTKKELIEIILRKDDVEKELRQEIDDHLLKENALANKVKTFEDSYNNVRQVLDWRGKTLKNTIKEAESLMRHNKRLKHYLFISVMLLVGVTVALVLLM